IAAGIILMATAIDTLITGHKPERIRVGEYVIVPIATPLIVGPGTMTLLITSSRLYGVLSTLMASYMAFVYTYVVLRFSRRIARLAGETFIHGLGRFMSIIIASFAVEMFIGGIEEFISTLQVVPRVYV
ncbi:MAG: MarC family protein, partial [Ignisphaera sp.]